MTTKSNEHTPEVFVEQIRLLLGNVGSSVVPAYLLALLMAVGLSQPGNVHALAGWCAAVIASKTVDALHARYYLAPARLTRLNARRVYAELMGLNILDAIAWASLSLVTLSSASMVEFMLVNSVLAGIAGSSMSLLSPVLPVFIAFIGVEFSIVAFKFWQLGDPSYQILTLALVLYFCSLSLQARNSCQAALSAIRLRFENSALLARLQVETARAVQAHREAVDANLAKSKFLAAASHDLRQPIHALGLFLAVLGNGKLQPEQRQVLDNARSVTLASQEMLNTLLDFSRIEAGVVEPEVAPFALQDLFFKLEKEFAPQADVKGLVYRTRDTSATVLSDRKLVELVLRNLVSNAIRYTNRGGLLVACRRRGEDWWVEVWDTGIGIAPHQHQEIFREFHQLGNAERDRRKGLGLGLAIAAGLVATLGHDLTLGSRPGRGSVFRLRLPATTLAARGEPMLRGDGTLARLEGVNVLVLEDDESVREGMCLLLRSFGCACVAADTLERALELALARLPDIVISDYRLRGAATGVDAIQEIRDVLGVALPAILITGDTAPGRLRDAHASGVQLLHKPVHPADLHRALAHELDRQPAATCPEAT